MKRAVGASLSSLTNVPFVARIIQKLHREINKSVSRSPELALASLYFKDIGKHLLDVDREAERTFQRALVGFPDVRVLGEESMNTGLDLSSEPKYCVLIDMIDGTDLLQRGFSNWCSAITVFHPRRRRIEAAYVALTEGTLYYALETEDGAFRVNLNDAAAGRMDSPSLTRLAAAPGKTTALKDASVCMYAQKSGSLLNLMSAYKERPLLRKWLEGNARHDAEHKRDAEGGVGFRFYNLAGNPMMVRLADHAVDFVLELGGQQPHDAVPGAFIAQRAGAFLGSAVERREITVTELAESLCRPADSKLKYVLAPSEALYQEMFALLQKPAAKKAAKSPVTTGSTAPQVRDLSP